jgi:putative hydrolase of the HAD superfamily
MWEEIALRMETFMHQKLGIHHVKIPALRMKYFEEYGTTLRGLQANYAIDAEAYLSYVHDIPVHEYLKPNKALQSLFMRLPQPKWILTNSDQNHAKRVLSNLGVEEYIHGIFGVTEMDYHSKPDPFVFSRALELTGTSSPNECLFVDDIPRNLIPAQEMGFITVRVGKDGKHPTAQYQIPSIENLAEAVPELLK